LSEFDVDYMLLDHYICITLLGVTLYMDYHLIWNLNLSMLSLDC